MQLDKCQRPTFTLPNLHRCASKSQRFTPNLGAPCRTYSHPSKSPSTCRSQSPRSINGGTEAPALAASGSVGICDTASRTSTHGWTLPTAVDPCTDAVPTPTPSDRARKTPVSGYGVDTIALRGPSSERFLEELPTKRFQAMYDDDDNELGEYQTSGQAAQHVGQTIVRIHGDRRTGQPEVAIQFSVPSVLDGHNRDAVPASKVSDVVDAVICEIQRHFVDVPPMQLFRLVRVDFARDFEQVQDPARTLHAISQLVVPRSQRDKLERGMTGRWQTLSRGNSDRWLARGYDKEMQLRDLANREPHRRALLLRVADESLGRLRWELELKADLLREKGLRTLTDLESERVDPLVEGYFERSRFNEVIGGTTRVQETMQSLIDEGRQSDVRGVLAVLGASLAGIDVPYSPNKVQEYRVLAKNLHLSPADLISSEREARRLDFASGLEIVEGRLLPD